MFLSKVTCMHAMRFSTLNRYLAATISFCVIVGGGSTPAVAASKLADRVVAVVNKDILTLRELERQAEQVTANLTKQGVALPPQSVLYHQLLEQMIDERVQLQRAVELGVRVDEAQLDDAIGNIAENNKLTVPELIKAVEKDGASYSQFREQIRRSMFINAARQRDVESQVNVSEFEIDAFLSSKGADAKGADFLLNNIVIAVPEGAAPEVVASKRQRAEDALAALKAGKPFADVAAQFSDASNALTGDKLEWRPMARIPDIYLGIAQKLAVGGVSDLIRASNGFHIIRLEDKRSESLGELVEQHHTRHILIKVNEGVSEADAKRRIDQIKVRLDTGADFVQLAKLQSEDASANLGGDLGWVNPGDTVPDFESAMKSLPLNRVSDPIRTPFGWHLIQVLERRKQDVSDARLRLEARNALRSKKIEEQTEQWVHQLRGQAFVDLRLDDE